MQCKSTIFSGHAVQRMFEWEISKEDVFEILAKGEVIAEYKDDKPFSSCLILGFLKRNPIHIVVAVDQTTGICYIITVYRPDPKLWAEDFKRRKLQ